MVKGRERGGGDDRHPSPRALRCWVNTVCLYPWRHTRDWNETERRAARWRRSAERQGRSASLSLLPLCDLASTKGCYVTAIYTRTPFSLTPSLMSRSAPCKPSGAAPFSFASFTHLIIFTQWERNCYFSGTLNNTSERTPAARAAARWPAETESQFVTTTQLTIQEMIKTSLKRCSGRWYIPCFALQREYTGQ